MKKVFKGEKMEKELITIIIPVYNVEKYIHKCIDSVINQTYKNLEIILVDDGSPDNCGEICDEYAKEDKRIKVIHKENGGLSDARNTGIDIAKGKYICFIDSDDYVEKEYIEILHTAIKKDRTDMAVSSHKVIYKNGTILEKATGEESILEPKEVLKRILYDDGIDLSAWAKLYKIELFTGVRYPKGQLFEDAATTYKLIDKCEKISIVSKPTYNYIIRSNSITNINFSEKKMDLIKSTEEMCNYIKDKYPYLKKACDRRAMYAYLSTLSQLAMSKKKFPKEQKIIMEYIKENKKEILIDKSVPKRDKIGIISTIFGFKFFCFVWRLYKIVRRT